MGRALIWGSFGVASAGIVVRFLPAGSVVNFVVAALALVPLAW